MRKLIVLTILTSGAYCASSSAQIELIEVLAFARAPVEIHSRDGNLITDLPLHEYLKLTEWDYNVGCSRPKTFDAVAIVQNNADTASTDILLRAEVFAFVGAFGSERESRVRKSVSTVDPISVDLLEGNEIRVVTFPSVDLQNIWQSIWKRNQWPMIPGD